MSAEIGLIAFSPAAIWFLCQRVGGGGGFGKRTSSVRRDRQQNRLLVSNLRLKGVETKRWCKHKTTSKNSDFVPKYPRNSLQIRLKLIAPHYALFDNDKVTVPIFLNDWTLAEVLSFALSSMIRAFPANDIPILMLFRTILGQKIMI
jgi:hypothetical protein